MKNLLIAFTLFLFASSTSVAQNSRELLKIAYYSNSASDLFVNTVKKQIKDDFQLTQALNLMTESKNFYSLYVDGKNNSSFFVLDSTNILPGVSVSGHFDEVVKENQLTYGREFFLDSEIDFNGNVEDLHWEFTDDYKDILGYNCRKATLANVPGYYAWFTTKLPINDGPGIYKGLPGLVLEVNTPFEFFSVMSLETITNDDYPHDEQMTDSNTNDSTSFEEMLAKKDNFRRMIIAGK